MIRWTAHGLAIVDFVHQPVSRPDWYGAALADNPLSVKPPALAADEQGQPLFAPADVVRQFVPRRAIVCLMGRGGSPLHAHLDILPKFKSRYVCWTVDKEREADPTFCFDFDKDPREMKQLQGVAAIVFDYGVFKFVTNRYAVVRVCYETLARGGLLVLTPEAFGCICCRPGGQRCKFHPLDETGLGKKEIEVQWTLAMVVNCFGSANTCFFRNKPHPFFLLPENLENTFDCIVARRA